MKKVKKEVKKVIPGGRANSSCVVGLHVRGLYVTIQLLLDYDKLEFGGPFLAPNTTR